MRYKQQLLIHLFHFHYHTFDSYGSLISMYTNLYIYIYIICVYIRILTTLSSTVVITQLLANTIHTHNIKHQYPRLLVISIGYNQRKTQEGRKGMYIHLSYSLNKNHAYIHSYIPGLSQLSLLIFLVTIVINFNNLHAHECLLYVYMYIFVT